jgi:hypothetical protein
MISMKKTALAVAVLATVGASVAIAEAAPIVNFNYNGTFTMYTPSGAVQGSGSPPFPPPNDPALSGTMTMDFNPTVGSGTAVITPSITFSGYWWTAHNITLQATGPGTVHAQMLFDWATNANILVDVDFSMTPVVCQNFPNCGMTVGDSFSIATLDSNSDGVPGIPMTGGPFQGFNASFGGTAVVSSVSAVPIPAAVWLFGSGLLGLVGVARRKKSS